VFLTNCFPSLSSVTDDDVQQANNMLSNGFDDVSSISDTDPMPDSISEDFDLSDYELNDENRNLINLTAAPSNGGKAQWDRAQTVSDLTSTPKHAILNGGNKSRFCPDNSTIQEGDEHDPTDASFIQRVPVNNDSSKNSLSNSSKGKRSKRSSFDSQSNGKSPVKCSPNHTFALSHQHVQSLLDSNSQLGRELQVARQMLSSTNHDMEKLRMTNERQSNQLTDLESKTNALDSRLKSEKESKLELSKKLEIAEQTITSLKGQLTDSSKVTSLVHIRESNEALIAKLKQEHHQSMQNLLADRERLLIRLEEANDKLKADHCKRNQSSPNVASTVEDTNLNRKYEEHLKSNLQVEFDIRLAEKDKIILELQQKLNDLTRDTSKQTDVSTGSCCVQRKKCDVINDLKNELEKSIQVSKKRRCDMEKLQDNLIQANSDLQNLKFELEECKQKEAEKLNDFIHKDDHEKQIHILQQNVDKLDEIRNDLEEKLHVLSLENHHLQQKTIIISKSEESEPNLRSNTFNLPTNETHNDSLKELVSHTMGQWKKQSETQFSQQIAEQSRQTRIHLLQELEHEVRRLVEQLDRAVDFDDNGCIRVRRSVAHQKETSHSPEIKLIIQPLRRLWLFLIESLAEKQSLIRAESDELRAARNQLEQSILNSESNEADESCNSQALEQLEQMREANEVLRTKLIKYRKHLQLLSKRHEIELKALREQCGQAMNQHEQSFVSRERETLRRFKQDSKHLLHQLDSKYNDLQIKMRSKCSSVVCQLVYSDNNTMQ
jgi:hypothetical protein